MIYADASIASFIKVDQGPQTAPPMSPPVRAHRHPPAGSAPVTPSPPKALIPTPAPPPRIFRFLPARPRRWLRSAIVSTTVKSAQRPAPVATAQTPRERLWVPI